MNKRKDVLRYSDISIGWSSRGKIKFGESPVNASRRESYEEIDFKIDRSQKNQLQYVARWGRIRLYKFDLTGCNVVPVDPFV
jgi:predicted NUDIX family NTP pyrophosphohydrolase